jgi:hypothetical protein
VTNVPFDPFERVQVSMASFGFYIDHRAMTGRPLGFAGLSKILTERKKLKCGDRQK